MVTVSEILQMSPYLGIRELITDDQDTDDIIALIQKKHAIHKPDYDKFSAIFWQGDAASTAKELFHFLSENVTYREETPGNQRVKGPGAILHDGYGDCKHYASFICGVADALNRQGYPIKCAYSFVSDTPQNEVHHVFAEIADSNKIFWVDPVVKRFDLRPTFYNKKSLKMRQQIGKLYAVSGTATMGKTNFLKSIAHGIQVNAANIKKAVTTNVKNAEHGLQVDAANAGKAIKVNAANLKKMALKVSLSTARNAFLALVGVNAFNLAKRASDCLAGPDKNKMLSRWKDLGGDPSKLVNTVNHGYKARHISAVPIAALVALATAIIAALAPFLKQSPQEQSAMNQANTTGIADLTAHAVDQASQGIAQSTFDTPAGSAIVTTGVDNMTGNPTIQVDSSDSPNGPDLTNLTVTAPTPFSAANQNIKNTLNDFWAGTKNFIAENKTLIGLGVAGYVGYKVITRKRKKRR